MLNDTLVRTHRRKEAFFCQHSQYSRRGGAACNEVDTVVQQQNEKQVKQYHKYMSHQRANIRRYATHHWPKAAA